MEKARKRLKYSPEISVEEAIRRSVLSVTNSKSNE
jgi:hypothetical protein